MKVASILAGTLQCLLHSPPAWHYLSSQAHRRKGVCSGVNFCMHCELERLTEQYEAAPRYFAPRAMVQSATRSGLFSMGDMHDSQEFFVHVLDGLLKANLRGAPKPTHTLRPSDNMSKKEAELEMERRAARAAAAEREQEGQTLQHHLFGGTLLKAITCSGCGHRIVRRERLPGLELAVSKPGEEPPPETRGGVSAWFRGAASRVSGYGATGQSTAPVSVEVC